MKKTKTKTKESKKGDPCAKSEAAETTELDRDTASEDESGNGGPADDSAASVEAPADETTELREKVDKLEDALLRARAEYQNFQRRAAVERAEAIRYANAGLMKSLLTVLDDFERAMSSPAGESETVDEGVRLVYQNLLKALREHGLETIETGHNPFDPSVHEAMMQQSSADHPSGTILEEFAKGYKLRDRVLRPSKVVVSKTAEPDADGKPAANEPDAAEHARK